MTISIVNGYVCMSSCDVAKAKKGQDPHPSTHATESDGRDRADDRGPAVLFGGVLGQVLTADGVSAADTTADTDPASKRSRKLTIDLLA